MRYYTQVLSKSSPPVRTFIIYDIDPRELEEIRRFMAENGLPTTQDDHLKSGMRHCTKLIAFKAGYKTSTNVCFEPQHNDIADIFMERFSGK